MKVRSALAAGTGILLLALLYHAGAGPGFWAFKHGFEWAALVAACAFIPIIGYFLPIKSSHIRIVRLNVPVILIVSALCAVAMWTFRQRLILPPPQGNGDGIFLLEQIPVFAELFGFRASFDEILELYIHSKFYLACKAFGISILDSYAILSCFAGFIYTAIVLDFLNNRPRRHWILGIALLLFTPAIQLFFGYVEHYDGPTVLIGACAMLALRWETPGHRQWLALGILAALGAAFHMMAGISILPLAYYCWIKSGNRASFLRNALHAAIPAGAVLGIVWIYFLLLAKHPIVLGESFFVKPPFYPWRQILSAKHFTDMFNLLLMGMPALLCVVPLLLFSRPRLPWRDQRIVFTSIGFAGFLLASFVIHPLLDFPADWDLFSIFQVYGNLFLFELLRTMDRAEEVDFQGLLPGILVVCMISTGLWINRNHKNPPESQLTLSRILANSEQFLSQIRTDRVFRDAPEGRKKKVAAVKLFLLGARNKAIRNGNSALTSEIDHEVLEFDRFAVLPEEEYKSNYPIIWGRLTDLNRRIEELPP
ncbi:MAG: hypothetical protein K8S54_03265 [Spirochaetia bacterium]|nr:hypothetical protein [Spirochaetia bacterium]